jgi:SpoVK/Ycf46/Vps4 family AAA+-type ATPase
VVLEDVDRMISRMETQEFFELLDHAMERVDGIFWIATTSRPEASPKTQLVRPGRFDESLRMDLPGTGLRQEILMNEFVVPFFPTLSDDEEKLLLELVEVTQGLSYAHFAEMRQIAARLKLDGRENELWAELRAYIQDQVIASDRSGGLSDATVHLRVRAEEVDSRLLTAALDMTDVLRALMDKTVADAVLTQSREMHSESKT